MNTHHLRSLSFLLFIFAPILAHADWKQFRGDDQLNAAPQADVPAEWGEGDIAWKVDIPGRAASSPIVVGDKVIATSASGYRNDRLHVAL